MSDTRPHVKIRPMTSSDIDQVVHLDKLSFPNPWPVRIYHNELARTERARLFVLEPGNIPHNPNGDRPRRWLKQLFNPVSLAEQPGRDLPISLIGYSGFWHVADESHVSTIAIHPTWRGQKLGELLLWIMIRQAFRQNARIVTLEVRVSNYLAQNLYRKYGFEILGRRKGYYSDNREDAYNMGVTPLDDAYRAKIVEYGKELAKHLRVTDKC